ncbi:MAG: hypothetical protein IH800_10305 [Myxococcales bacterium]|nr:hypothetical protein [Myxococcales bacterium]
MMRSCTGSWLALFAVLFVAACANPMPSFLHTRHRENLSIDPQELKHLQFYISTQVLAKDLSTPGSEGVIIVPQLTRGMATEVGPSWLRVRFSEGGSGVVFVAVVTQGDSAYWLATEIEGQQGFHKLKDLPKKILLNQGTAYELIYGDNARLLISEKDLSKLIEQRRHLEGVKASD